MAIANIQWIISSILGIISLRQLSHDSLNSRTKWNRVYDYVVVGGGTAGPVVAARLAEIPNVSVLLIEAGGPQNFDSDIPAFSKKLANTSFDWNYPIVTQNNTYFGFIDNKRNMSRGKGFGGCAMHNEMNYYRENPDYFQMWADMTGVNNWNYYDVLPYFRKSENNLDQQLVRTYPEFHTTGGPVSVSSIEPDPLLMAYLGASRLMGYPVVEDRRNPFGSTVMQRTIRDGLRQTTSMGFLERNPRRNLHILGKTEVTKVLFDKEKRANGVQFIRDNRTHTVFARKEVIVSAGAVGSPKLLLLSGVGPQEHLEEMGIPVVSDLKVGENFFNIPVVVINFDVKDQSLIDKPLETIENYNEYFIKKGGPLAYKASGMTCFPQVHYEGRPGLCNGAILPRISFLGSDLEELVKEFKPEFKDQWRDYYRPYLNRTQFVLVTLIKRPRSNGTLMLASSDPLENPVLDPCLFCKDPDMTDFIKTFKLALEMFTSPLMQPFIELYKKPIPGCNPCPNDYFCDEYIKCWVQTYTSSTYPIGGCRIGVNTDDNAVVDHRLRVFGVTGLRVIDSSIIPVPTDQSAALTIMIGEYGADFIKEENYPYANYLSKKR